VLSAVCQMKVVILSSIWPAAIEQLRSRHQTEVSLGLSGADLAAALKEAEVVVLRSGVRLDRRALEAARQLRLIVRAGAGLEGIDCEYSSERGIRVIAVPLSSQSVAEHTLGLALALSHQIVRQHMALAAGRWEKHSSHGRDLFGRRLGLLGFGRIGQRTAELASALGMQIIAHDRSPHQPAKQTVAARLGIRFVPLDELFQTADILAIQTPLNDATRGLVDARRLALMQPSALLINVGRGGTVDESALFAALRDRRLAGAALDVFEREPTGDNPLLTLPNFIGTPHIAAQTEDAQEQVGRTVVEIIDRFASGGDWMSQGLLIV
jgi:D-3-phosphoglycerate dehydrogenase / 2-oxoglutarate reductase